MNEDLRDSYRVLELDADSPPEAVKRSYRDLVKLWHPDRYSPGSPLQHKAEERLKEINLAYERIIKKPHAAGPGEPPPKSAHAAPEAAEEPPPRKRSWVDDEGDAPETESAGQPETHGMETAQETAVPPDSPADEPPPVAAPPPVPPPRSAGRSLRWAWAGLALVLIGVGAWGVQALRRPPPAEVAAPAAAASLPPVAGGAAATEAAASADVPAAPAAFGAPAATPSAPAPPATAAPVAGAPTPPLDGTLAAVRLGYFTVGSSKAEVAAVQGKPDSFSSTTFQYGSSTVTFRDDRVESWRDGSPALKARVSSALITPVLDYFMVGSTRNEVVAVQGRPDRSTATQYQYGSSLVIFDRDRVVAWEAGSIPLRARTDRPLPAEHLTLFALGSSKDDVVSIQGLPDRFTATEFHYGTSTVYFRDDKVINWQMGSPPLKVRIPVAPGAIPAPGN